MAIRRKTYKGIYTDENEVFVCDTATDLSLLPTDAPQGSSAFVIEDSTTYMIDSSGVWSEVQIGASGGGDVTLTSIDITENGTYRAPSGTAYNKVTVAVEDIPDPDPADGKTHIWARIDEDTPDERKGFTLAWNQSVSNGVEIDWGDSGTIVETLSGPVVSFSGDVSVNSIAVSIEPVQSGSGDPSPDNVRPITGWTGANVYVSPTSDPADGQTYSVIFPTEAGTVYGGTLDVLSGTLTVDTVYLELNSSMKFTLHPYNGMNGVYTWIPSLMPYPESRAKGICSHSNKVGTRTGEENAIWIGVNSQIVYWIGILDILGLSTVEEFKTWLGTQTVQIAYKLGDPAHYTVYQLTPQQITTLFGENNVWADTGDTTAEIEYYDVQTVSGTGAVSLTHQYENGGEYEITMEAVEGSISFTGTSGTAGTSIYGSKANARCYNRQRITRISVGANAAVGSYMAHYCYGLSRVGLPSTLASVGDHAFEECFSLPTIEIPNGVTSIGEYAFSYCHSLESADIPDSVVSIGAYAFRNCYGLREIDFPSRLTSISDYTYQGCYNLTSIDIPNTVTSIGNGAFHSCYGLTSVRIPAAVRSIGDSAFLNCYGVSEYHIGATTPPTLASTNAFTGMASDCVIYVPRSTNQTVLNAYKAATNWVTYASRMQEEAE